MKRQHDRHLWLFFAPRLSRNLIVSVWAARRDDGLDVLVSIVNVGALTAFTLLHASVVGYFVVRRGAPARTAHRVVPLFGAAVTIAVVAAASPLAKIVGAIWLGVGIVVGSVQARRVGGRASSAPTD